MKFFHRASASNFFKWFVGVSGACLPLVLSFGQPPAIQGYQLLSYQEGLSDRAIRDIYQDSQGFLWVATDNGLNRYDGYHFQVFNSNSGSRFRIEESRLRKVTELKNKKLAILNARKEPSAELLDIFSFKNQLIKLDKNAGIEGRALDVFTENKGDLFVVSASSNGLHVYKMNDACYFQKTGETRLPGFQVPNEVELIRGRSGNFWMLDTLNGLMEFTIRGRLLRHFNMEQINSLANALGAPYFTSVLHEDVKGRLWVAFPFRQGIFTIDPQSLMLVRPKGLSGGEVFSGLWEDKRGRLLLATFKSFGRVQKLFLVDSGGEVVDYQAVLGIDDKINVIYGQDFKRQLFLGTFVGLYNINFTQRPVRWVLADRQLADSDWDNGISIRSITGDGKGNIYIARELKAWYHLRLPSFEIDTILPKDEAGNPIRLWCNSNLVYDEAGYLWGGSCATDLSGMLHRYELASGHTKSYEIPGKIIRHLIKSRNGGLWMLCGVENSEGHLLHFDPTTEKFTTYEDQGGINPFKNLFPSYLAEGQNGKIWVGTDEGLVGIDVGKKESHIIKRSKNGLTNDNILVIHEAENGRLWLGTYGGLSIFDPTTGRSESYSLEDGLSNNIVCGILPDGKGNYWISTFSGLSFFETNSRLFSNFNKDKGLTFNEFNRLAFYRDNLENLYFGTLNGLNIFTSEDFRKERPVSFPIQLTRVVKTTKSGSLKVQENNLIDLQEVVFSPNEIQMRLEFALPELTNPGQNKFAYRIDGASEDWRYIGTQNYLELNRLPVGAYQLRIKAAPAQGFWKTEEFSLKLIVKQAFYHNTYFQIFLPVGLLFSGYFLYRYLIARVRKKEQERTAINKKFATLELQALQSQMNPHFVFNALGAIQYFIQNNNSKAADEYLAKFAKLVRLFLESSKNKYIPLREEIKLLTLYVEMEQMRFGDKFHAEIVVDDSIDISSCEIPAVLIQPFVENAINHGLFHKETKGNLIVHFKDEQGEAILCIVEDNGIGRRKARELKEVSNNNHKSMGIQLVKERLDVLQKVDELKIHFTINDLEDDFEGKTGTRVTIRVPLFD